MNSPQTTPIAPDARNDLLLANATAGALYEAINACDSPDQLDAVCKLLWERYGAGLLNDNEASYLQGCLDRRRPLSIRTKLGKFAP